MFFRVLLVRFGLFGLGVARAPKKGISTYFNNNKDYIPAYTKPI